MEPKCTHEEALTKVRSECATEKKAKKAAMKAGVPLEALDAAKSAGIGWTTLLALIVQYGPAVVDIIKTLFKK